MSFSAWIEQIGEGNFLALGGLLIGVVFGFWAQRSRFCLRAASLEVAHWQMGSKLAVWLFAFSAALIGTQAFILLGWLDVGNARQLASRGTLSGALIGGALFGIGMVLARGCASRLLVLSATGNLRALLSGLVFAVVAQSAMTGLLSPLRLAISNLWAIDGGAGRDLLALLGWNHWFGLAFGVFWLCGGVLFAWRSRLNWAALVGGLLVGLMVAAAWLFNFQVANQSFNVVPVKSLSFTGPAADMLMLVLSP
ncbi:MAG: YeeE/YedE family protein, partial [Burkholderiales bacterium]|nr:YeeE/YedE family protein [Burkholderiales bacterium]